MGMLREAGGRRAAAAASACVAWPTWCKGPAAMTGGECTALCRLMLPQLEQAALLTSVRLVAQRVSSEQAS